MSTRTGSGRDSARGRAGRTSRTPRSGRGVAGRQPQWRRQCSRLHPCVVPLGFVPTSLGTVNAHLGISPGGTAEGWFRRRQAVSIVILLVSGVDGEAHRSDAGEPDCGEVRRSRAGVPALLRRTATGRRFAPGVPNALAGRPRVNIQNDHGKAKAYQVRQVLAAIARLEEQE